MKSFFKILHHIVVGLVFSNRMFLTGLGWVFFSLGSIGIVVPLMPTTIFWILATVCFAKSCPEMRDKIYAMGPIGTIIKNFNEKTARLFRFSSKKS